MFSREQMAVLSDECEPVSVYPNPFMSGCTELTPLGESCGTVDLEVVPAGEAAFLVEVVMDRGVDGGEFLQGSTAPEPEHRPLPSSEWQVRVLCSMVHPATGFLPVRRTKLLQRGAIRPQLVGYQDMRPTVALH